MLCGLDRERRIGTPHDMRNMFFCGGAENAVAAGEGKDGNVTDTVYYAAHGLD